MHASRLAWLGAHGVTGFPCMQCLTQIRKCAAEFQIVDAFDELTTADAVAEAHKRYTGRGPSKFMAFIEKPAQQHQRQQVSVKPPPPSAAPPSAAAQRPDHGSTGAVESHAAGTSGAGAGVGAGAGGDVATATGASSGAGAGTGAGVGTSAGAGAGVGGEMDARTPVPAPTTSATPATASRGDIALMEYRMEMAMGARKNPPV